MKTLSVFCSPARYVQGEGATASLGAEISRLSLGQRVFIVAGKSAMKHLAVPWESSFGQAALDYEVLEFAGECTRTEIERIKSAALLWQAEVIVGAGGGKVLDAARAVACDLDLPVVNCPTVASSDAPCSALSVVYKENGEFDSYLFYKRNPDLVLVDSSMVAKAPARLLSAGMGDALATWFEARAVREANKLNQVGGAPTISATALAKLCYETLLADGAASLAAVNRSEVDDHLERLIEANTLLSGLGFESGGLAVAHSVHNGLTTVEETHAFYHGEKVAFGVLVQLILENRSEDEILEVMNFCHSVNLPLTFSQLGIEKVETALIDRIAQRTVAPGETAHNEPFLVDARMVAEALRQADRRGRDFLGSGR